MLAPWERDDACAPVGGRQTGPRRFRAGFMESAERHIYADLRRNKGPAPNPFLPMAWGRWRGRVASVTEGATPPSPPLARPQPAAPRPPPLRGPPPHCCATGRKAASSTPPRLVISLTVMNRIILPALAA